ncbi:hypothetical protein D6783_02845, partial [Candidatus Woesearchaeota archaeon]
MNQNGYAIDDFNVTGELLPNQNVTATAGGVQEWFERFSSQTDSFGSVTFSYNTTGNPSGNYSAVSLASAGGFNDNLNSTTFEVVPDTTPPSIENPFFSPAVINQTHTTRLNVTVTDVSIIAGVNATFVYPNGTSITVPLSYGGNDVYYYDFSDTNQSGRYNVSTIVAADEFGNTNTSTYTSLYFNVTPSPPDPFDLLAPASGTESQNLLPTMSWEQSGDEHFANYSLVFDKDPAFGSVDYEYVTSPVTNTSKTVEFALDANSVYYWMVIARDVFGTERNSTSTFTYITDTLVPSVILGSPLDGAVLGNAVVTFNYTPSDTNTLDACTLYGNFSGSWGPNVTNASPTKDVPNFLTSTLPNGVFVWNVYCNDSAGNGAFASANYSLTVDLLPPVVDLVSPPNNSFENTTNIITFTANATDAFSNVTSCELVLDGVVKDMNSNVQDGVPFNLTAFVANGNHTWSVNCTDYFGREGASVEYRIEVAAFDKDPPLITLNFPVDTFLGSSSTEMNFTPEDATGIANCSLYLDGVLNQTCGGGLPQYPNQVQAETGFIGVTGTSATVTLKNTYNRSKAFIVRRFATWNQDATQEPDGGTATIEWAGCSGDLCNQLTATRVAGDAEDLIASYSVLQANNIRVWNFTLDWAFGERNKTFVPSPSLPSTFASSCFVNVHRTTRIASANVNDFAEAEVRSNITSATSVVFERLAEADADPEAGVSVGEVVCFLDRSTVQQTFGTLPEGNNQFLDITINAVDLSRSFALHNHKQPDDGVGQNAIINNLTSETNLELFVAENGATGAGQTPQVTAYVVELEPSANVSVRHVRITPTSSDQNITASFSPAVADLNRTVLLCDNSMSAGGGTAHTRDYWAYSLENESTIRLINYRTRGASQLTQVNCWVVEWPSMTTYNWNNSRSCVVENNEVSTFFVDNLSEGSHSWNVSCYDNSTDNNLGFSSVETFTVDLHDPSVTLNAPANGGFVPDALVTFNYTPFDVNLDICFLYTNESGNWSGVQNTTSPTSGVPNTFVRSFADGTYTWNVRCDDAAGKYAFASLNWSFNVDETPPSYSNLTRSPQSPANYSPAGVFSFNSSWQDNFGVDTVWIEHNFSGSFVNETVTEGANGTYNFTTGPLGAGVYQYRWHANDTQGNQNQTTWLSYTVNKAVSEVNLSLNGTDGNITINEDAVINLSAEMVVPSFGAVELYVNGTLEASGQSPLSALHNFSDPGVYNVTARYPATQNYSESAETHFVTVLDITNPNVTLVSPEKNGTVGSNSVLFKYNVSDFSAIANCSLWINGSFNQEDNTVLKNETQSFSTNLADGNYTWQVRCEDAYGNVGESEIRNVTVFNTITIYLTENTSQSVYERGDVVVSTSTTKDVFGNALETNVTVDFILGNTTLPWWNASWERRKQLVLNDSSGENRTGVLVSVNVSGLGGFVQDCQKEMRVVWQNSTIMVEVDSSVVGGDNTSWCEVQFLANLTAGEVNTHYFAYYNNSGASAPGYAVNTWRTIFSDDMEVGGAADAGNWSESASLGVETWGLDSGVAR